MPINDNMFTLENVCPCLFIWVRIAQVAQESSARQCDDSDCGSHEGQGAFARRLRKSAPLDAHDTMMESHSVYKTGVQPLHCAPAHRRTLHTVHPLTRLWTHSSVARAIARTMKWFIFLGLALHAAAQFQPPGVPFVSSVTVAPGFSASVIFSNLTAPRGITFDSESNLLVVDRGFGITAFPDSSDPAGWSRQVVIQNPNFTQGIQVQGRRLYASTASQALLFNYDPATKSVSDDPRVVVDGLPADGGEALSIIVLPVADL
jgi:hypothetical protein